MINVNKRKQECILWVHSYSYLMGNKFCGNKKHRKEKYGGTII